MKQWDRRFTAALLAAGLLLSLTACGAAAPQETALLQVTHGEALETSSTVAENTGYALCWDAEKQAVFLEDRQTGRRWGTEPAVAAAGEGRSNVLSRAALVLQYAEPNALDVSTITSTVGAGRNGRILAYPVDGGVRVEYWFDDLEIGVPVTYQLLEDGLRVSCIPAEITEKENRVCGVSIAPMMASVPNDAPDSWLFVPSGSGAQIDVNTVTGGVTYAEEVYGTDPAHNVLVTRNNTRGVRLPVFGVKHGDDGLLGVITSGAATASVEAQAGNERVLYSSVYATFAIRGTETTEVTIGTVRDICIFSEEKNREPLLAVEYYPLQGTEASYAGMAQRYRRYLIDGGMQETVAQESALYLNLLGGTRLQRFFLGVPYRATQALTTLEQAQTILEQSAAAAGTQPVVKLVGYGSGGLDAHKPAGGLTVSGATGGVKGLKTLSAYCREQAIPLYFDFDLIHYNRSGSGISRFFDTAKAPNRQAVRLYPVQTALRSPNTDFPASYLVRRDRLSALAEQAAAVAAEWGLSGVSLNTAGNTAYSDYGRVGCAVKGGADTDFAAVAAAVSGRGLSLCGSEANAYAAVRSEYLFDVPLSSSGFSAFAAEIPFYEMVFKGCIPMGSEPVNLSSDPVRTVLRAAETGCGLTYTLTGSFEKTDLDAATPLLGSAYYADVLPSLGEQVRRIAPLTEAVSGAHICRYAVEGELRIVGYDNDVTVLVNYGSAPAATAYGEVPAKDFRLVSGEGTV